MTINQCPNWNFFKSNDVKIRHSCGWPIAITWQYLLLFFFWGGVTLLLLCACIKHPSHRKACPRTLDLFKPLIWSSPSHCHTCNVLNITIFFLIICTSICIINIKKSLILLTCRVPVSKMSWASTFVTLLCPGKFINKLRCHRSRTSKKNLKTLNWKN